MGQRKQKSGVQLQLALIGLLVGTVSVLGYFELSSAPTFQLPGFAGPTVQSAIGAETIAGQASVIDGDTIEIHGTRIRLYGIDAPEGGQYCYVGGKPIRCGQRAALTLADKIANHTVTCEPKDRDRYGRIVAVCRAAGEDLNAWMVAEGQAVAYRQYSTDYVPQEQRAKASKRGVWKEGFIFPWDWRRENNNDRRTLPPSFKRAPSNTAPSISARSNNAPSGQCSIKGNINQNGERIYHMPGGDFYSRTIINEAKGERWFCSEAEARAAGWRRSRR